MWISLEGLLGGKAGPLLVQALNRLLRRGWCCPVDRECGSTLWVTQKSYGNSLVHAVQKSLLPKFSPVSWSSGRRRKRAGGKSKVTPREQRMKAGTSLIDLWRYLWEQEFGLGAVQKHHRETESVNTTSPLPRTCTAVTQTTHTPFSLAWLTQTHTYMCTNI